MKKPTYTWAFRPHFRANAFGWKASKLASQRLKEALTEIKAVARVDPLNAADGAIVLMEKIWPARAHVDSSSGARGNAVNKTVQELVDIVVAACGGPATWRRPAFQDVCSLPSHDDRPDVPIHIDVLRSVRTNNV